MRVRTFLRARGDCGGGRRRAIRSPRAGDRQERLGLPLPLETPTATNSVVASIRRDPSRVAAAAAVCVRVPRVHARSHCAQPFRPPTATVANNILYYYSAYTRHYDDNVVRFGYVVVRSE